MLSLAAEAAEAADGAQLRARMPEQEHRAIVILRLFDGLN